MPALQDTMAPTIDDTLESRVSAECPDNVREVLYHAWGHDLSGLKKLLETEGLAQSQDPKTGETPLHAAIRACGKAEPSDATEGEDEEEDGTVEEAKEVVQELFLSGAIWNDVDSNNETAGCVALRLGRTSLYEMCVDAGVRAELLFALMDGYEQLSSADDMEGVEADEAEGVEADAGNAETTTEATKEPADASKQEFVPPDAGEPQVTSEQYLQSEIKYDGDKLLDSDLNGVMMAWETDIMRRSVDALIPNGETGKRILNIGFGMGIVDGMFADLKPSKHHIIEAHPGVLEHIRNGKTKFGSDWEKSGPEEGAFKVHAGRWQDIVPQLMEQGEIYDAIYFDTFGEDYSQLRDFFTDSIVAILDQDGRFSFFNGLGADRRICYDVYAKVVELHCEEAGLDVQWDVSDVDMSALDQDGKGDWEGVRRRYWTLDSKLPTLTHTLNKPSFANNPQNTDYLFAHSWDKLPERLTTTVK